MTSSATPIEINASWSDVFGDGAGSEPYLQITELDRPITYFVGRNGSGKSKCARAMARAVPNSRLLSTDRLVGLMAFDNYGWGSAPSLYKGVPLDDSSRPHIDQVSRDSGGATVELYALREQPEVWLRVAAFLRRALHRVIELRESAGYLDPYVRVGDVEYSLLRDEGHGLREIVVLLAAAYRPDWSLLVVDEPELHLHPSLARLWLGELERECRRSGRRAVIISHEPSLISPTAIADLESIWLFRQGHRPTAIASLVEPDQRDQVTASIVQNSSLVSQLVFSPRPVLVEGVLDVAAFQVALRRGHPAEVLTQTDFVNCGGSGGVALWFSIVVKAGLDFKAVGDLDCLLDRNVQRAMDRVPSVAERYKSECLIEPATTSTVVRPLIEAMRSSGVAADPKSRAVWLATELRRETGHRARVKKVLEIWRDAGLWLHEAGTLEDLLNVDKQREAIVDAAAKEGPIDNVAEWVAFTLDTHGDVEKLLGAAVERIAHRLQEALRLSPEAVFRRPVGSTAETDSQLVVVEPTAEGQRHRITVRRPQEFAGRWLEFDRDTPPSSLNLQESTAPNVDETS